MVSRRPPLPGPDDPLTCTGCGTTIRFGEEKARIERQVREVVDERLRGKLGPRFRESSTAAGGS